MTTRFDCARDNLLAALDASLVSKHLSSEEVAQLKEVLEGELTILEDNHPRERSI